jgi:transposase-like protein
MSKSVIDAKCFHDEVAAYAWVEARLWPNGPICPHCGGVDRISKMAGKSTRIGVYKCYQCRKPFRVTVGTVFEASHVPLRLWLQAMYLLCSSKKGISSNQLHRTLGITLKTAWFMSHRIREAMRTVGMEPMGGAGEVVEIDETLMGKVEGAPKRLHTGGTQHRNIVLSLVQRGGEVRSFHIDGTTSATLGAIMNANIVKETALMTDQAKWYPGVARGFAGHQTVTHSEDEYVRHQFWIDEFNRLHAEPIHTNTVEGYYSVFKRGMKGIYQHCKEKHLHRYLAEFDFRYNNRVRLGCDDVERTERALKGVVGKRLTYRSAGH